MDQALPDIGEFNNAIFHKRNSLAYLLSFSMELMQADQAGLLYGTDGTGDCFLPPGQWDRGVIDQFSVRGMLRPLTRVFGRYYVRLTRLSPVHLFRTDPMGQRIEKDGVIAYTLRNHQEFYDSGVKILMIDAFSRQTMDSGVSQFAKVPVMSYDGVEFRPQKDICADTRIVKRFRSQNFMAAYIPDYGAIVLSTVRDDTLVHGDGTFEYGEGLKSRLNMLISCIETASLAFLGRVRGKSAAQMIWRKEKGFRRTLARLQKKESMLKVQEKQLWALGAVTPDQLNMPPKAVRNGVFAFMDMKGSVGLSKRLPPHGYFHILSCCHEIAAENAARFGCRLDNFIGDGVFFQNLSVFDLPGAYVPDISERLMLMTLLLASVLTEVQMLTSGRHRVDPQGKVYDLVKTHRIQIGFRAGMSRGRAQVGPLGSSQRKIITAIGEAVNLASRLESAGRANHIHITESMAEQLQDVQVSRETRTVYALSMRQPYGKERTDGTGFGFLDFYRSHFGITGEAMVEADEAGYKEFVGVRTRLLRCLPDSGPSVCPGI